MKTMMNSIRVVGTLLTVAVLLTCSASAWAQVVTTGDFVLPIDVQWNQETIPAGHYHFTLQAGQSGEFGGLLLIRNEQQKARMLSVSAGIGATPAHSALTIIRCKGKWHVTSLALAPVGLTLNYSVPSQGKAERETEASVQVIAVRVVKS